MSDVSAILPAARREPRLGAWVGTSLAALYAGALAALALGVFVFGGDYWLIARDARPDHPLHALLRPGGPVGLWLGVLGTALMGIMLVYSVRKAARRVRWLGPVPAWLRFHIICGVMGPVFIVLHDGLLMPRGVIAVGFWCMVLVALSGGFGRYVYGFFPRNAAGLVEDLDVAREDLAVLRAELVAATAGVESDAIGRAVALARDLERPRSALGLVPLSWETHRRARAIRGLLRDAALAPEVRARATHALVGQVRLARSLATWEVAGRLLRYWHLFHLPLAKAMYAIVALHVLTALLFGGLSALWTWPVEAP